MSLESPIGEKSIITQVTLVPIFIAYLKLQMQIDSEKASRDPRYIPQYHQKDIEAVIAQIQGGICSGFSAWIGHKLLRGKLQKALTELETLNILKENGFKEDGTFQDNGKFLIRQKKSGTPKGEELNRKYNPMVDLLEDILSNMRWLQSGHEIPFRDSWDEYELAPEVNKEFISVLSEEPIQIKKLIAFCLTNFKIEEALLAPEIFDKETMANLKALFQKSGEKSALRYLDQLLQGAIEKSVAKEKAVITTVRQAEWDKLINFVVGEETPKLQHNFSIHAILKKEEVEDTLKQVLSSFKSAKILRLRIPQHTLLVYKEDENYYFSDPNNGRLFGPYTKASVNELTSLILELFPENTTNFEFGIDAFSDPIKGEHEPLDPAEMISELLQKRLKTYGENLVDLSSDKGWTSLHLAATNGYLSAVEELLKNKADIGATNSSGWSALHLAALAGHLHVVQKLLEKGANIKAVISSGETALHLAAMNGHLNVVQKLLENGANVEAITPYGNTPLHLAAKNGHLNVVEALLNKKADFSAINLDEETALHLAATHGHLNVVQKLLEQGAIIETGNEQKNTALHLAAKNGHLSVVLKLLEKDAKIEAVNSDGETALHLAAKNGHLNVMQMLLGKGAMIEAPNSTGKTALYLAVEEGHLNIVQELLKKKPNIAVSNKSGDTVLHLSAFRGDLKIVQELLDKGANIHAVNSNGETALHLAARNGHLQVMLELLKKGAKLGAINSKKETALALAERNGHTEIVKFIKNRLNIDLLLAAEEGRVGDLQKLIEDGADINSTDSEGNTLLHLAVKHKHLKVVHVLLNNKTDWSDNLKGMSVLHFAIEAENSEILKEIMLKSSSTGHPSMKSRLKESIASNRILDQGTLIPIFIAYLRLQLEKDKEKASDPQYIPQYHEKEIEAIIAQIEHGICSGFSAFLGHKLLRGKFQETLDEIEILKTLEKIGFYQDGSFKDNGEFLINQKNPGTPAGEELNRKYNPMVALLEDTLSNMRWLQAEHEIPFKDSWDEYEFAPEVNKEFISILSEEPIEPKNLIAFCRTNFQLKEALSVPESFKKENMEKLKTVLLKSGEKAALRYLDQLLAGALENAVSKGKEIRRTAMQFEWDKLINFIVGEKGNKLQHNFSLNTILKKNEVENIIQQVVSSFKSSKMVNISAAGHSVLLYIEEGKYYFSDPNEGKLVGPYTKATISLLTSYVLHHLIPFMTNTFQFSINAFGDPSKSYLDAPLDGAQMLSKLLKKRVETLGWNFIEAHDDKGWTALHQAAYSGNSNVVNELLKNKANISATNFDGNTALLLAANQGHLKVVQTLLVNGANIEDITSQKSTALHLAARNGHLNVVQELLEKGVNINAINSPYEMTALHLAAMNGHLSVVQELLKNKKTDIEAMIRSGGTALHLAAQEGHLNVVQLLLQEGARIEASTKLRNTPLHLAAQSGRLNVVQALLKNDAYIEASNSIGDHPLHLAARNGHLKIVQELLAAKANVNSTNNEGKTALQIAKDCKHTKIVKILESYQPHPPILPQQKLSEKQVSESGSSEVEPAGSKTPRKP